ncbi:cysteine--tRNA ligase [Candidatus Saccharibacteria bacterium]|nr:cysteine--tRNA ligase [Candidatus Saccharibacteria bacterium]
MIRFYNSLSRRLEDFKPINDKQVKLYSCGPTVYDFATVGNWRAFIFVDSLRRYLTNAGYSVKHVMNITDVGHLASDMDEGQDKLEAGAKREGKSVWQIASDYTAAFKLAAASLNLLPPNGYEGKHDSFARATDFIKPQIEIIQQLLKTGYAYQTDQAIYFDVSRQQDYGKLSGQSLADKQTAVRSQVVSDPAKRQPQDFALWFFVVGRFAKHTMRWDSPWGAGFPGWHLECSAIIHATLGEPIDIHTGGVDHIGTHHTNEIAQTEAAYGTPLANYWLHNEFLLVEGAKMAKSLGNFITIDDVKAKGFEPLALRLFFLQSHYRSQLNFSWTALQSSQTFLRRLQAWSDLQFQPQLGHKASAAKSYNAVLSRVNQALSDDLNTPVALASVAKLPELAEADGVDTAAQKILLDQLEDLFGLDLSQRQDLDSDQKKLLAKRESARRSNNFPLADELRQQLAATGVLLNDTPHGAIWSRAG